MYDWKKICKIFNSLGIPKNVYNPTKSIPHHQKNGWCGWNIICSERSRGKTTNLLLLGMCFNALYGTQIQYIRQKKDRIAPKKADELFRTIRFFGYIEKITDGRWNSCILKARRWYYTLIDEEGKEIDRASEHFMYMLSLDEAEDFKSTYNAPLGDFILVDEFINSSYIQNEFVVLCDLLKTIIRDRTDILLILATNMLNPHSLYFKELEIYEKMLVLKNGQSEIVKTQKGTSIFIEILKAGEETDKQKKLSNTKFFGFNNPLLVNITGGDWAIDNVPHIVHTKDDKILMSNIYLFFLNRFIRLELVFNEKVGYHVNVVWGNEPHTDSIIYTIEEIEDTRYVFKTGYRKFDKFLWSLYERNLFFYATNDIGSFLKNYLNACKMKK